jgi:hypothetical protein
MNRVRRGAYWVAPPLLCLLLHWRGFTSWFSGDDFAWLGQNLDIHSFGDFLSALFRPAAQGTLRPWSERAFFMAGFGLFGLNPLPFRAVVFATQFANLALVTWIGDRLSGRRGPGFWAAVFWTIHGALLFPLGWACVYNQVMCGFFLLLAFYFLLRFIETGAARYNILQWGDVHPRVRRARNQHGVSGGRGRLYLAVRPQVLPVPLRQRFLLRVR